MNQSKVTVQSFSLALLNISTIYCFK